MANYLDSDGLLYLKGKLDARYASAAQGSKADSAIQNPETKANGNFLKFNGTTWVAANVPDTGVLSVSAGDNSVVIGGTAANPTVKVAANKFDEYGAAAAVQGETDKTVKDAIDAAEAAQDTADAAVPNTRKVNGKALSSDVTLYGSDILYAAGGDTLNDLIDSKQEEIEDLDTIREQAENAIPNPETKVNGNFLKFNGTSWVAADVPESGVLSVTAGDDTITIGGTASAPTVKVTAEKFDAYGEAAEVDAKLNENVSIKPSGNFFSVDGDTVTFAASYKNLKNGTTSTKEEVIGLANSEDAGMMSPAQVAALSDLGSRVEALEGRTVRLLYTAKQNPTAAEIQAFVIAQGYTTQSEWATIGVVVQATNHIWRCFSSTESGETTYEWRDIGLDTVQQFTNSIAGIIKGAGEVEGKVYAEDDGTGSVYGWDALVTRVANAEADIAEKADASDLEDYWAKSELVAITNSQIDTIFAD